MWIGHVLFCTVSNRQAFTNVRIFFMLLKHSLATAAVAMSTLTTVQGAGNNTACSWGSGSAFRRAWRQRACQKTGDTSM